VSIDTVVEAGRPTHQKTLVLQVRYIGARRRFVDPKANPLSTLPQVKPPILEFFGLKEGSADGGTKTYLFALDGEVLPNQSATLASLAADKHELKLDLIERFEQG
jgi:hypothetical protein